MKKIIIVSLLILAMIGGGNAFAAYQNTEAGTSIQSLGSSATINYQTAGVTKSSTSAVDATTTVSKNGGIKQTGATWTDLPNTNNLVIGTGTSYTFSVINSGNFTESVAAAIINKAGGFAGAWQASLSLSSIPISREGVSTGITLYVTADANANDGDEGTLSVSLNGTDASALYAQYTGANSYTYGASGNIVTSLAFKAQAPKIYITKNVTVQAPASYVSAGGNATDPVPGATLTYALDYYNFGGAAASNVEIIDVIPSNTEYNAATGGSSRQWDYGAGWSAVVPASPVDGTVQKVKWAIGAVPPSSGGQVTLNVVIK